MPRKAREKSKTGMYNIILKGNIDIFRDDDDYDEFLLRLDNSSAEILGIGMVRNYVFMCLKESEDGIAADMRTVIISYARYYNKKYNIEGRLFDGRFKSEPINSQKELINSVSIVQDVTQITGEDARVTDNESTDYEMIPFYASSMGLKNRRRAIQKTVTKKPPVVSAINKPKESEKKQPEQQQKKSLPSWLL